MPTLFSQLARFCLFGGLLLGSLAGCNHGGGGAETDAGEEDASRVAVRTARAQTLSLDETVDGIGRTEALPNRLVTLTPAMQGHVEAIRANLGDSLGHGDLVVELDTTLAKADVAEKQANRDTLKAALDLLAAPPRPEERKGLEIGVETAKATVARAQAALDRLQPLAARKEVSAAQMYEAEQMLVQAQLQQKSAEAQLDLLVAGPRPEAVEEAKARLAAAEEALGLSRAHLALHSICSPIAGVLDSVTCHPGQTVAAGVPIAEIVDTNQINVVVWLPPPMASRVKVGQTARLEVTGAEPEKPESEPNKEEPAAPPDESESANSQTEPEAAAATDAEPETAVADQPAATGIEGEVASIGRIVDAQTGNLPIRVLVDNAVGRIAIGQIVPVTIVVHRRVDELVVPSTALVDLGEGPLLMVVRDGKVVPLHPTSVATHGTWTIIAGTDLEVGEEVVIEGGFNLPEGTPVHVEAETPAVAEARR